MLKHVEYFQAACTISTTMFRSLTGDKIGHMTNKIMLRSVATMQLRGNLTKVELGIMISGHVPYVSKLRAISLDKFH